MPSINRIRVNNVKYNFGTQFYDDFTMRMHGKNTLYDLANGGGKSVLMLLLMQNMIPNCTLDEKQPIEKLFRTGNGNTTIHSLVEWKLDPGEDSEGYRYMTTGFCARKAKDVSENEAESAKGDVASIEYFNYCIFYREYNKNDIINLPLVKDGTRMNYQTLRNYLKDLERGDMRLRVRVFERKGEYQRYISNFGLHESQWEIIRGINKTEGHVRTYFENNYRTTRKVVEDLLIEEIIEKAFMVKTAREDDGSSSMAKMLMDIKEQLTVLAKKKKDIATYDHQIELVNVLADKVASFMDIYKERSNLTDTLANICVTGAEFAKNDEEQMELLAKARDDKRRMKDEQKKYLECLKVAKDKRELDGLKENEAAINSKLKAAKDRLSELTEDYNLKESINEYLDYIADRTKLYQYDQMVKNMMSESSFDEKTMYTYAYNIKMRTDIMLTDIRSRIASITDELQENRLKKEYQQKLLSEARTALAVALSRKQAADEEIVSLSEKLSKLRMSMNDIQFVDYEEQLDANGTLLLELKEELAQIGREITDDKKLLNDEKLSLILKQEQLEACKRETEECTIARDKYEEAKGKLDNIRNIYKKENIDDLLTTISQKITMTIMDIYSIEQDIAISEKRSRQLAEGRIIETSKAVKKVLNYIETRHGNMAMTGMDYVMALPVEAKEKLLAANPEIVYGIVVEDYDSIKDDPNILDVNTGEQMVMIYDMQSVEEKAMHLSDHVFAVGAKAEYIIDPETAQKLIKANDATSKELMMRKEVKEEMLEALREDHTFVIRLTESGILQAEERLALAREKEAKLNDSIEETEEAIKKLRTHIDMLTKEESKTSEEYELGCEDNNKLVTVVSIAELVKKQEDIAEKAAEDIKRLEDNVTELTNQAAEENLDVEEAKAKLNILKEKESELVREWDDNYKAYYDIDNEYDIISYSDDELKARFRAIVEAGSGDKRAIEDKQELMDTIRTAMDRTLKSIERRGTNLDKLKELEKNNRLFASNSDVMYAAKQGINAAKDQITGYEAEIRDSSQKISKLEGKIEYAIRNIEAAYGSYEEQNASLSEIVSNLENGEALLKRLDSEYKSCEQEYKEYFRQQGYMIELYKDVKRIIITNDIDIENASPMLESKDKLRDIFEETLLKYDKSTKGLERAKNELLKFKGNTASTLDQMEVFELARTIRDDVIIPSDYSEAQDLLSNLNTTTEYIRLERDRIEKSLVDMETIKSNFEEQCLQRCLDVRTELDKLPKLSRIIVDDEPIQMVGLNIPYVKDEFLKQRMSDYIDRLVAQADDYDKDSDRIKFIRSSLALKKLFGVIVSDMNAIKLSLYKRERIKEQSRYLKYEEAVGSTGQSQGIYIQFLVSVINYISGIYQTGNEEIRTKTVFIDNPFGAAKDVYIWEPIFAMLKANKVQLIVPARGATPAITGRFDVNYILGQQMSNGKQLTVVTDYTSQVDQEELEYQELTYEQATFDFI